MGNNTAYSIRNLIAKDCGLKRKIVTNKMPFMANDKLSYFDCVDVIYDLEHKFKVKLPESDFIKYDTVGGLIKSIVTEMKQRKK